MHAAGDGTPDRVGQANDGRRERGGKDAAQAAEKGRYAMKALTSFWNAIAPPLGDHLWQSTLVVLVAGLLTLLLQKNHARARYWLWLAASVKFLVPCSWLVALGSKLAWRSSITSPTALYVTVEQITKPST